MAKRREQKTALKKLLKAAERRLLMEFETKTRARKSGRHYTHLIDAADALRRNLTGRTS